MADEKVPRAYNRGPLVYNQRYDLFLHRKCPTMYDLFKLRVTAGRITISCPAQTRSTSPVSTAHTSPSTSPAS